MLKTTIGLQFNIVLPFLFVVDHFLQGTSTFTQVSHLFCITFRNIDGGTAAILCLYAPCSASIQQWSRVIKLKACSTDSTRANSRKRSDLGISLPIKHYQTGKSNVPGITK